MYGGQNMDEHFEAILIAHKKAQEAVQEGHVRYQEELSSLGQSKQDLYRSMEEEYKSTFNSLESDFKSQLELVLAQEKELTQNKIESYRKLFRGVAEEMEEDLLDKVIKYHGK